MHGGVQENAVMQTCVGSVAGLAFTGGFGSYLIAMDHQSYLNLGNSKGNSPNVRPKHLTHPPSTGMPGHMPKSAHAVSATPPAHAGLQMLSSGCT